MPRNRHFRCRKRCLYQEVDRGGARPGSSTAVGDLCNLPSKANPSSSTSDANSATSRQACSPAGARRWLVAGSHAARPLAAGGRKPLSIALRVLRERGRRVQRPPAPSLLSPTSRHADVVSLSMRYRRTPSLPTSLIGWSASFFFTTADRKPRTACACQPVSVINVSMLAPFALRSFFRMSSDLLFLDVGDLDAGSERLAVFVTFFFCPTAPAFACS